MKRSRRVLSILTLSLLLALSAAEPAAARSASATPAEAVSVPTSQHQPGAATRAPQPPAQEERPSTAVLTLAAILIAQGLLIVVVFRRWR